MSKQKTIINVLIAFAMVFSLLASSVGAVQAGDDKPYSVDPRLLEAALEHPDETFRVIVQKETKGDKVEEGDDLESVVVNGGGQIKKHLVMINSFSAELTGKKIERLGKHPKVRWISLDAPMLTTAGPGMESVRDAFLSTSYDGNDGTASWSSPWMEAGEIGTSGWDVVATESGEYDLTNYLVDGSDGGLIKVVSNANCAADQCLELGGNFGSPTTVDGVSLSREVNLQGAASAFLSFSYRRDTSRSRVSVMLSASSDGGVTWTDLAEYKLNDSDAEQISQSFELTQFISGNTTIRFLISGSFPREDHTYMYVDDVEIAYAYPSAFLPTVKADQLGGLDGSGVTVAVIDSGINYHDDFTDQNWEWRLIDNMSFAEGGAEDLYAHGTHVAGVIGGNGALSGGQYRGMAPGVNLLNLKVSDKDGMTYESDVIESMEWVYYNKDAYNIRVINLSMNSILAQSYHTSPLSAAVEVLWFNGVVVVVSAGNNGTADGPSTIYPPANDPFVITVGASEDAGTATTADDSMGIYSAYGVTADGFAKPDLVAPGRNLIAPLAEKATTGYTEHPLHRVGDYYFRMSGTSMSAPVVSGAVALLLQDEPNLNPDQVKYRLISSAGSVSGLPYLDVYAAVTAGTTDSANQGIMPSMTLSTGEDGIDFASVGWNSVGWNSVGWNSVGWNSVGWNSVGWNSVGWNSVGWNSVGWNCSIWDD